MDTIYIILLLFVILVSIYFIFIFFQRYKQNKEKQRKEFEINKKRIIEQLEGFTSEISSLGASYIAHRDEMKIVNKWEQVYSYYSKQSCTGDKELDQYINSFINNYNNIHSIVIEKNNIFVSKEKERCEQFLSCIDNKSLDEQQRTIVVSDEDNTLVVAGAGSGKTLTIAAKVAYLCKEKGIDPNDILLISFTRKASNELTERINARLGIQIEAATFHKIGLDVISNNLKYRPNVAENEPTDFLNKYFETKVVNDTSLIKNLLTYFSLYLSIPANLDQFDTLGEAYEYQRSMDFETLKSKYNAAVLSEQTNIKTQELEKEKITLAGEHVKSIEEVIIANYLYLNGIEYEYEKTYPYENPDPYRKAYKPDFYLTDYDIYLEHFGINRQGRLPWLSQIEEEKYIDSMIWKRNFHKCNGTKLIETYSYYNSEGILLDELEKLLKANGVLFKERDAYEIFCKTYGNKSDKYFKEFIKLCATFITLFKSNGYQLSDLKTLDYNNNDYSNSYYRKRTQLFKDIVYTLIEAYEIYLKETGAIDFSDMINKATEALNSTKNIHMYKYVIIDEFQDISIARYKLIKEILNITGAKLLCVGDDWQSIYRFAGSDISVFTLFEEYFGYSNIQKIEHTYRNPQELIDVTGGFIMKNPLQLRKTLSSDKSINESISIIGYSDKLSKDKTISFNFSGALKFAIDEIINDYGSESSILLLGRTKYDFELLLESELFKVKNESSIKYVFSESTPISFLSVHKAKGLEADNVILLNFRNDILGFPNKISDDPLLELVLSNKDSFLYAEERRLLYVAITRTRNKAYILMDLNRPSEFYHDFEKSPLVNVMAKRISSNNCPRCKSGHLVIRENNRTGEKFLGCSNYPQCDYYVKDISLIKERRICPQCGGYLVQRKGSKGPFMGCSNYPKCNYIKKLDYISE